MTWGEREHAQTPAAPEWVPAWAPSVPTLDYVNKSLQAVLAVLIFGWLLWHLSMRGVGATAARVAPGS